MCWDVAMTMTPGYMTAEPDGIIVVWAMADMHNMAWCGDIQPL